MHPPLTLHRHPMCAEVLFLVEMVPCFDKCLTTGIVLLAACMVQIIEQFQKCHLDHPIAKFFGECTDLKIKLDRCFRQEKALRRKANFEESKKLKERLKAYRDENAE
ncbi:uncharacterized protein LOC127809609 isoform X2 [Diospyros lotus]|nr:uncharacterized protein LOC127809609 isoform X2 [Diospyros lotus]